MTSQEWYPQDYHDAVVNTFSEEELIKLLEKPGCAPRFVYGALMLPTVLKYFINESQSVSIHKRMTRATVSGYKLYQFSDTSTPVLRPCSKPDSVVEGMLVLGLDEKQRNAIYEVEGGLMDLVSVQARIHLIDKLEGHEVRSAKTVDAGAFAWTGSADALIPVESSRWAVVGFLKEPFYEQIVASQRRQALGNWDRPSTVSDGV
ncbi:uncharacterized protein KD926_004212 [Aspergillus affinis]|uniref:uncharacterized protein n=1 Tax=Aspergillus affinis TaxID=1070780 RepID=UPI0022FEF0C2|nr:uncharacterized protein KD926_004212 [Aspergillus affinis]KAI9035268.1 hypothetical protein KD926_004212 [Aspergillus affinis]